MVLVKKKKFIFVMNARFKYSVDDYGYKRKSFIYITWTIYFSESEQSLSKTADLHTQRAQYSFR